MKKPRYKTYRVKLIKCIEMRQSSKGLISYWVRIQTKFIRIAQKYFFILKEQGVKAFLLNDHAKSCLVKKKKVRCIGTTNAGVRCTQLTLGSIYCWQHDETSPKPAGGKAFLAFFKNLAGKKSTDFFKGSRLVRVL